jgi:hypothetical protein
MYKLFGKLRPLSKSKIMIGLLGKIDFGQQIGYKSVDGTIVSCAPFASK